MKILLKTIAATMVIASTFTPVAAADQMPTQGARAVTMWWVVFNRPDACFGSPDPTANCTTADVFGQPFLNSVASGEPDPSLIAPNAGAEIAVLFGTGGVTSPSGQIKLVSSLYKVAPATLDGLPQGVDPMGFGRGLERDNAEIHLVIRDHGVPNHSDLMPQITNFLDPYCSDPNLLYTGGDNLCADRQFAVFGPDETGADFIYSFADPASPLARGGAMILRDGPSVRAIVDAQLTR